MDHAGFNTMVQCGWRTFHVDSLSKIGFWSTIKLAAFAGDCTLSLP